ncbi:titin-like isoform X2 [Pseudomyrmex gracilis]|uniref:titin-like isoform X2 n=1 Tax=Pseudomyrmex gracilis TaxID=219809 RepID=UPI0009955A24|nr:titin-like isoform X2 [Pseudomyrmex gracilis]
MSRESVCRCPPSCPIVRAQLRDAIEQAPYLIDEFFPRKKNDVLDHPLDDIVRDNKLKPVIAAAYEKLVRPEEIVKYEPPKAVEDTIEAKPIELDIQEQIVREPPSIQEPIVIPTEKILDRDEKKIDLVEEKELIKKPTIIPEPIVIAPDKILDRDEEKIDLIEEKELIKEPTIIPEPIVISPDKILDRDEKKIDLVEEKELIKEPTIIPELIVIPPDKILDRDEEKIDLIEEKELIKEPTIIPEPIVIPPDKILDRDDRKIDLVEEEELIEELKKLPEPITHIEKILDRNDKKIDSIEEKEFVEEPKKLPIIVPSEKKANHDTNDVIKEKKISDNKTVAISPNKVSVAIEEPEIIKNEISREAEEIKLETPRELKEHLKPEEPVKDSQPEERLSLPTDYEKFIDEEYRKVLPRKKSPELQREEVTVSDKRAVKEVNARRAERIVSPAEDACDETCPLIQKQKELIARKLEERQRIVDNYYLTKGFSYFEEVCTCSLACVIYNLSRDSFVKSIFASLALFAVGLKLCSELDAWEMPSRISK